MFKKKSPAPERPAKSATKKAAKVDQNAALIAECSKYYGVEYSDLKSFVVDCNKAADKMASYAKIGYNPMDAARMSEKLGKLADQVEVD